MFEAGPVRWVPRLGAHRTAGILPVNLYSFPDATELRLKSCPNSIQGLLSIILHGKVIGRRQLLKEVDAFFGADFL
jgi:hypothetical protein